MGNIVSTGVIHRVPSDMKKELMASPALLSVWNNLTPLARNEWICWVTAVKKVETRQDHLKRMREDLAKGKRRPCCWPGCAHRNKTGK